MRYTLPLAGLGHSLYCQHGSKQPSLLLVLPLGAGDTPQAPNLCVYLKRLWPSLPVNAYMCMCCYDRADSCKAVAAEVVQSIWCRSGCSNRPPSTAHRQNCGAQRHPREDRCDLLALQLTSQILSAQ